MRTTGSAQITPPLFEIAVYRLGKDDWRSETDQRIERSVQDILDQFGDLQVSAEQVERIEARTRSHTQPTCWTYNEITGWIRLVRDGPGRCIKAYLFPVTSTEARGLRRRQYRRGFRPYPFAQGIPMHKLFEHHFTPFDTNEVIMTALRGSLHATTGKGGGLENRALDLDAFENVGPHIDWVALLARSI